MSVVRGLLTVVFPKYVQILAIRVTMSVRSKIFGFLKNPIIYLFGKFYFCIFTDVP